MISSLIAIKKLEHLKLKTDLLACDEPAWEHNYQVEKIINMIGNPLVSDEELIAKISLFVKNNLGNLSCSYCKDIELIFNVAKKIREGIEDKITKAIVQVQFENVLLSLEELLQNPEISSIVKEQTLLETQLLAKEFLLEMLPKIKELAEKYGFVDEQEES